MTLDIAMTTTEAKQVTTKIKSVLRSMTADIEILVNLIEQAEAGTAWRALDYPSWSAYVAAEFSDALKGLERALRVPVVAKLSATGMSVRAIASVTGTSVGTAHNDVTEAGVQSLNTCSEKPLTAGTDGKSYVRNGRPTSTGMADLSNAVPEPRAKPRRKSLPDQYWTALYDLDKVVRRLEKLHADDRFDRNREALHDRHWRLLSEIQSVIWDAEMDLSGNLKCDRCEERMAPTRDRSAKCEACR